MPIVVERRQGIACGVKLVGRAAGAFFESCSSGSADSMPMVCQAYGADRC